MDFESYIGRERQLIARIEKERAECNSHEPRAEIGNYQLAEDEIRLLKAGDYVADKAGVATDAVKALDERMSHLRKVERDVNEKNEAFLRRVSDWEARFDARYVELMENMGRDMSLLEVRNVELIRRIEATEKAMKDLSDRAERNLRAISEKAESSIREVSGTTEASMRDIGQATVADVERLVDTVRAAQADFEASVNEKLEQDKQTLERIKYMIAAMNEIIKT